MDVPIVDPQQEIDKPGHYHTLHHGSLPSARNPAIQHLPITDTLSSNILTVSLPFREDGSNKVEVSAVQQSEESEEQRKVRSSVL